MNCDRMDSTPSRAESKIFCGGSTGSVTENSTVLACLGGGRIAGTNRGSRNGCTRSHRLNEQFIPSPFFAQELILSDLPKGINPSHTTTISEHAGLRYRLGTQRSGHAKWQTNAFASTACTSKKSGQIASRSRPITTQSYVE